MKPIKKIYKDISCGIYDNETITVSIYNDKIKIKSPYIKWIGNTGSLAYQQRLLDAPKLTPKLLTFLNQDCEQSCWDALFFAGLI